MFWFRWNKFSRSYSSFSVVASAPYRNPEAALTAEFESRHHVRHSRAPRTERRAAIEHRIEDLARFVVFLSPEQSSASPQPGQLHGQRIELQAQTKHSIPARGD